ncbi:unnamed protein product [Litomosoides sigmodontis]|uniref:Uncharacterized protein n=1 Tax=Litomosoides sigmodontis TaxID=42156 RepID=A0A3P6T1B6_LITSI|nr:unnamed protein product [Litomosoides sigmodontis]
MQSDMEKRPWGSEFDSHCSQKQPHRSSHSTTATDQSHYIIITIEQIWRSDEESGSSRKLCSIQEFHQVLDVGGTLKYESIIVIVIACQSIVSPSLCKHGGKVDLA